jgi:serine/threonine protein kinase
MALALQVAHDSGVIHRDLKPANIMIDDQGEPIIMDFGLARRSLAETAQLTQEGQMLGTPAYMPPEQVTGDVQAMGPASDVYSLGVVLYELLTGTRPFDGDIISLMSQITLDPPVPPARRRPELEPAWDAICLKALAKAPAQRWPSMRALTTALEESLLPVGRIGNPSHVPAFAAAPPLRTSPSEATLALRVEGTPYLYRPWQGQDIISVGRQKRHPGDPPDRGNDFVLRVAGNDQATARISRRHFEIRRTTTGHVVVDCSKAGLLLNGQPVPKGMPTPLQAGDRLLVAGVVTLEVLLQPGLPGVVSNLVEVPTAGSPGQLVLETSMGDMLTLE